MLFFTALLEKASNTGFAWIVQAQLLVGLDITDRGPVRRFQWASLRIGDRLVRVDTKSRPRGEASPLGQGESQGYLTASSTVFELAKLTVLRARPWPGDPGRLNHRTMEAANSRLSQISDSRAGPLVTAGFASAGGRPQLALGLRACLDRANNMHLRESSESFLRRRRDAGMRG
jgi:hypothetical protein